MHDRFAVIGPDGKKYPTWHPPTVINPATGRSARSVTSTAAIRTASDLHDWVAAHFASAGKEEFSGVPFGLTTEALDAYSAANPGTATRQEDNPGYKVDYENDVALIGADGGALGVTCDYVTLVHQGSHSPDATQNNVHDTLYAVRCSDGTEVIASTLSRFGNGGEYTRSCDPGTKVTTLPTGYPGGAGERSIPDRACVESVFLVPPGRTTSVWALYEKWTSNGAERTADRELVAFDRLGRVQPEPVRRPRPAIGRTVDLSRDRVERRPRQRPAVRRRARDGTRGRRARSTAPTATSTWRARPSTTRAARSAGTRTRTAAMRRHSPSRANSRQLIATSDTPTRPRVQQQVFGRNRIHDAPGVHAPN